MWRRIFFGVCIGVMARFSPGQATTMPAVGESAAGAPFVHVTGVTQAQGNFWVATEGEGAWEYAGGKWEHFARAGDGEGPGDDYLYAVAADRKGRVWVGTLNHGVSVYNGEKWQTYTTWGPSVGPAGVHVYALAVGPKDGDVWIGTDAGVTRYSESADSWRTYGRAEGLPTDQVRGIAVASDGDVYLATAVDGVVIGRDVDGYKKWEQVIGPEEIPLVGSGKGLPGRETNCVTVDREGHVYVGTPRGLATSGDNGKSWRYVRGKDFVESARGSYGGVPAGWTPQGEALLAEDWVTSLSVDLSGMLWVGHREKGYERLDPKTSAVLFSSEQAPMGADGKLVVNDVTGVVTSDDGRKVLVGRYLAGLTWCDDPRAVGPIAAKIERLSDRSTPPLPKAAAAPTVEELKLWEEQVAALPAGNPVGGYIGEDWTTGGDWVGRLGRQLAIMGAFQDFRNSDAYNATIITGGHYGIDGPYTHTHAADVKSVRALYGLTSGRRAESETNDGSFSDELAATTLEGPDLWVKVNIPEGPHRVSLYMLNPDGQTSRNALRDYVVELRQDDRVKPQEGAHDLSSARDLSAEDRLALERLPVVARARASQMFQGVYEQFVVNQPGLYWVKVNRNHSFVTKVFGVFVDRIGPGWEKATHAFWFQVDNDPPAADVQGAGQSERGREAVKLYQLAEATWGKPGAEGVVKRAQMTAYRAGEAERLDPNVLALWRWELGLWGTPDRDMFDQRMAAGLAKLRAQQ